MGKSANNILIFLAIICMDLLAGMEFDIFVPSFPQLQSYFNLSTFWVEALLSVNFIGYALSIFFVGKFADFFGRKQVILSGLVAFILGSLFCFYGEFYSFLLVGRFFQGVGVAAPAILSFIIIADHYPLKQQQFFMAILNGLINGAIATAPVIGSYIALHFNWRGSFFALLILGLFTLLMTLLFIPRYIPLREANSLTAIGYANLFRSKPLMLLIFTLLFIYVPYWVFVGMSPLLYIKSLGISLSRFGYYQGILALVFALGSILYGLWIKNFRYDQKKMLWFANAIFAFGAILILLASFFDSKNANFITLGILVFVIGQIIPSTLLYPLLLNYLPEAKARASALLQALKLIFTALSLQIAGYFYHGSFEDIGIIILVIILVGMLGLIFVIKNSKLMEKN